MLKYNIHEEGNFGVTTPIFDYILGTRFKGTYDVNGKPIRIKHQMVD